MPQVTHDQRLLLRARPRRAITGFVAAGLLGVIAGSASARSQETRPAAVRRLAAFFWHDSPNDLAAFAGIRAALKEAGLPHELTVHQSSSDAGRAKVLLGEIRAAGCDLVFAMGTQATLLARAHAGDLPIVYTAVTNPVASGVVSGWEGSGANLAGNSNWIPPETVLRVFRLAVPNLARLGMLRSRNAGVVSAAELSAMREHLAGKDVPNVEVVEALVDDASGIAAGVRKLTEAGVQAIWVPIDITIYQNMAAVRAAAGTVPLLSSSLQGTREGAVAGVLVDYELLGKRAAAIALDVLRRGRPAAEIPVDTMRSYQVIVNLGAARRVGYELPSSLLVLADVLIDADADRERR